MADITIYIEELKIVNCADDDEDMNLSLKVYVRDSNNKRRRVYSHKYSDVYVEEEGKVGNDSRCTFFKGVRIEHLAKVEKVELAVHFKTLDGDGFNWGGVHVHTKEICALHNGRNDFNERKEHSSDDKCEGIYELDYTIYLE